MPQKRDVLTHLTRDELVAITDAFDLPVNDRRVKDQLIEAIVSSNKVTLATILAGYPRDRLKELCRGLGLDDGGREKAPLVERLTGACGPEAWGSDSSRRAHAKPDSPSSVLPLDDMKIQGDHDLAWKQIFLGFSKQC